MTSNNASWIEECLNAVETSDEFDHGVKSEKLVEAIRRVLGLTEVPDPYMNSEGRIVVKLGGYVFSQGDAGIATGGIRLLSSCKYCTSGHWSKSLTSKTDVGRIIRDGLPPGSCTADRTRPKLDIAA